jgi:hypothetical protein
MWIFKNRTCKRTKNLPHYDCMPNWFTNKKLTLYQSHANYEEKRNIHLKWDGGTLLWCGHCYDNQLPICLYRGCPFGKFVNGWKKCGKRWFNISFRWWYQFFRKSRTSKILFIWCYVSKYVRQCNSNIMF